MANVQRTGDADLAVQVGVGALIRNSASLLFLAQRGPSARNERGLWEFPGGEVTFGELLQDAVKREFSEEYGMTVGDLRLLTVADHILMEEKQHWVAILYVGRHAAGAPVIREPEKCSAIGWFHLDQLPHPLSPASQHGLAAYRALGAV